MKLHSCFNANVFTSDPSATFIFGAKIITIDTVIVEIYPFYSEHVVF